MRLARRMFRAMDEPRCLIRRVDARTATSFGRVRAVACAQGALSREPVRRTSAPRSCEQFLLAVELRG